MKKFFSCCFPGKKEEIDVKDENWENKEEVVENSNNNQNVEQQNSTPPNNPQKDEKTLEANVNTNSQKNTQGEIKKEDPLEYINSHRRINDNEIKDSEILIVEEQENNGNNYIFDKKEIKINAGGLIGGRNAKDGVAIFGVRKEGNENCPLDFNLNYESKNNFPYTFLIHYENQKYYIKSFQNEDTENNILFLKLGSNYDLELKERELIAVGNLVFRVSLVDNDKLEVCGLSPKGDSTNKKVFDPKEIKEVTIGRGSDCTVSYPKEKSISKVQTTFKYSDETKKWTIVDGSKTKISTNGTWIFGRHSYEIKNQTYAQILNSKVKFTLIKNIE